MQTAKIGHLFLKIEKIGELIELNILRKHVSKLEDEASKERGGLPRRGTDFD